jgi:3-methyladenine DNA glycosylase AlkC
MDLSIDKTISRKGARRMSEIPPTILKQLNAGTLPTVNLVEWLAVDLLQLMQKVSQNFDAPELFPIVKKKLKDSPGAGVNQRHCIIGEALFQWTDANSQHKDLMTEFSVHSSDIVRGWAVYMLAADKKLSLKKLLTGIKVFADDHHFGVRELAWMAARPSIAANLESALELLQPWTQSKSANVRRFASEVTRPRGVWCKHIERLKDKPFLAAALLHPLSADPEKYVKDSVGNWLNDASKTRPEWVMEICDQWLQEKNGNQHTEYIIRKALRTLQSKG